MKDKKALHREVYEYEECDNPECGKRGPDVKPVTIGGQTQWLCSTCKDKAILENTRKLSAEVLRSLEKVANTLDSMKKFEPANELTKIMEKIAQRFDDIDDGEPVCEICGDKVTNDNAPVGTEPICSKCEESLSHADIVDDDVSVCEDCGGAMSSVGPDRCRCNEEVF